MAATETVAAGALEGCEVHQVRCFQQNGDDGFDLRLSVAPPLEGDGGDTKNEDRPYTIYVLDAEPCMFALIVVVVRSLYFYKKVQDGGHFPQILVVGVSHARRVTDERSYWFKKYNAAVNKVANILPDAITNTVSNMMPDAMTDQLHRVESETDIPAGEPEPVEDHWSRLRRERRRDFTPPMRGVTSDTDMPADKIKWNPDANEGQGLAFLSALEKDVIPFIESKFNTHPDAERRCLVGASLSGLLACQGLLSSDIWGNVVLGSPSVWWDDAILLDMVRDAPLPVAPGADVLITVGSEETENMLGGAKLLEEALNARAGTEAALWRTKHVVLHGEDHHTCKAAMAGTLVRWLMINWGHKISYQDDDENPMDEAEYCRRYDALLTAHHDQMADQPLIGIDASVLEPAMYGEENSKKISKEERELLDNLLG